MRKIIIATHVFSPGGAQALRDYCVRRKYNMIFIGHPLFGNLFTWSFSFIDTIWQIIKTFDRYDNFVGFNSLNSLAGIILKKLGYVKKVVFVTVDYVPQRFQNKLLNYIYHKLDYFCVRNADLIWNSSSGVEDLIMKLREKNGYLVCYRKKQIPVPDGCDNLPLVSFDKLHLNEVGFVGHLKEEIGLQLAIEAWPKIQTVIPNAKLIIIGSGPYEDTLKRMAKGLNIKFLGFIGDIKKVYKVLSYCAIAIAPYKQTLDNYQQFGDVGKVKNYLSLGLPTVIVKVPKIAIELDKSKCGIAIDYNKEEFIRAVLKLLLHRKLLKKYRENSHTLAQKYSWDSVYDRALNYSPLTFNTR